MSEQTEMWAVVEIMGHRVRAGLCSDALLAGATFLRVEHPPTVDGADPAVEFYAPSSIFAVRPCSQEEAEAAASMYPWPARYGLTTGPPALGVSLGGFDDDDDEALDVRTCRQCGCTDLEACWPPCSWVEADLCSSCVA